MQTLNVFSDFTSAFCYVTEAVVRERAKRGDLRVIYRAYELFPAPARPSPPSEDEPPPSAAAPLARDAGLPLQVPPYRPRTRKAHEAYRAAEELGRGAEFRGAVFAAYWEEGRDIGRVDVLQEIATSVDLPGMDLRIALDLDVHRGAIEADLALARRLNIDSVPTLYVGTGKDAAVYVGAVTAAELDAALEAAH